MDDLKRTQKQEQDCEMLYQRELVSVSKNAGLGGAGLVTGILLNYAGTMLATRIIGTEAWGVFFLAQTILGNMLLFCTLGLDQGALRYVALYQGRGDLARMKGTILYCLKSVLALSVGVMFLIFILAPALADIVFKLPDLRLALQILIVALPFGTSAEVMISSLQGMRLIGSSTMVKYVFQPGTRLAILGTLLAVGLSLSAVVMATSFSVILAAVFAYLKLRQKSDGFWPATVPILEQAEIRKFSNPLFADGILNNMIAALPVLLLGYYWTSSEVAIYGIGLRLGMVVSLPLSAMNLIFAPTISNLYGRGDKAALARLFTTATKWVFTLSLAVGLVVILFASSFLSMFGGDFTAGVAALQLIVLGQFINASVGSVGYMLAMTGRPMVNLINSAVLIILTAALSYVFIPKYGFFGAALSTAASMGIVNLIRLGEVYYFERLHPYSWSYLKPLVAGAVAALVGWLVRAGLPEGSVFPPTLGVLAFGAIFVACLLVLKLEEEDRLILDIVGRKLKLR